MHIAVLGIDLGKNSCSVVGLDGTGAVVKRRRMRPESIAAFTEKLPACVVAMEACCGAHHLGRVMASQGHQVRLMSPSLATSATPLGGWLRALMQRVHKNAAVVALANKLARIVWVVLRRGEEFDAAAVKAVA